MGGEGKKDSGWVARVSKGLDKGGKEEGKRKRRGGLHQLLNYRKRGIPERKKWGEKGNALFVGI